MASALNLSVEILSFRFSVPLCLWTAPPV